jgi:uncharacterized repeat protein (TIGR03803 family)
MAGSKQDATSILIFETNLRTGTIALVLMVIFATFVMAATTAQGQSYSVLANFTGTNGNNPLYVTLDEAGNIYGTTYYGGRYGSSGPGTVFKLTRRGSSWTLTSLYDFSGQADGGKPYGGVVFGPDGALYGTASSGGFYGYGVVYKLQPPPSRCAAVFCYWTETVLYNFTDLSDGWSPQGSLAFDAAGNIYGTVLYGGYDGAGVAYKLSPSQGQWNLTVLHSFTNGSDGGIPVDGMIFDQAGNLYGTSEGGSFNLGVVYELTPGSSGWTETVLHNFTGGDDGEYPAGLAMDSHGNIYGITGGEGDPNWGTVFELQPTANGFSYSVLYAFPPQLGGEPGFTNVPVLDSAGNLYSALTFGPGLAFELSPSDSGWNFSTLHTFNGQDGKYPGGGMALDAEGNLYGTAENGGTDNFGVVWEVTP